MQNCKISLFKHLLTLTTNFNSNNNIMNDIIEDFNEWDDYEYIEELEHLLALSHIATDTTSSLSSSSSINEQSANLPIWNSIEYGQNHPDWKNFLTSLRG